MFYVCESFVVHWISNFFNEVEWDIVELAAATILT